MSLTTLINIGFKEERTVHILSEESVYLKSKKIRLLSIDRLLEGEPPVSPLESLCILLELNTKN